MEQQIWIREKHFPCRGEGCDECDEGWVEKWASVRDFMRDHAREVGEAAQRHAADRAARR